MGVRFNLSAEVQERWPGLVSDDCDHVEIVGSALWDRYFVFEEADKSDTAEQLLNDFAKSKPLRELNQKYGLGLSEEIILQAESNVNPNPPSYLTFKPW